MRVEYICHSCLLIETNGVKITFDPWITGTAYYNQWHLFPKPIDISKVEQADVVLFSHGHEDHLHTASLNRINRKAKIFFPFQWREGIESYFRHLNFDDITEAISFKEYSIAPGIKITYLGYSLESVVVLECEGYTIVNINDALNSNHETATQYLLQQIKRRWNKIDFLFSGWSGAGYFPNKVHYRTKNDVEVGLIREQYFADNFCKFTKALQPQISVPFTPGFVLLNDENRWINEVKFPRNIVNEYYAKNFDASATIHFPIVYPGDYFEETSFHPVSDYHQMESEKLMYSSLDKEMEEEIKVANKNDFVEDSFVKNLRDNLLYWMNRNKVLYEPEVIADAIFSLHFKDVEKNNFFNISHTENEFTIVQADAPSVQDKLVIATTAALLDYNLKRPWGGDALTIGYGLDVDVFDELSLEKNLDIVCVRLITRYPLFKDDYKNNAGRILKYYFSNPSLTNLWIKQKLLLKPYINKYPFNERDHWISYKKCDLCKVCNMPELDFEKLDNLVQVN